MLIIVATTLFTMYKLRLKNALHSNFKWAEPQVDSVALDYLTWWVSTKGSPLYHVLEHDVAREFRHQLNSFNYTQACEMVSDVLEGEHITIKAINRILIDGVKYTFLDVDQLCKAVNAHLELCDSIFSPSESTWENGAISDLIHEGLKSLFDAAIRAEVAKLDRNQDVLSQELPTNEDISGFVNWVVNKCKDAIKSSIGKEVLLVCDSDQYNRRIATVGHRIFYGEKNGNV